MRLGAGTHQRPSARSPRCLGPLSPPPYQRKDHFHQRAKDEGFRSRAAYKLLEIQQKHRLLRSGQRVADLGCWPGGWLQVAAGAVGPRGRVVGVDRAAIDPPLNNANIFSFVADLADSDTSDRILSLLDGQAGVVLSDAAPKLTGVRERDRALEEQLLLAVSASLAPLLKPSGALLMKVLQGPEADRVERDIRKRFQSAKQLKTTATRKGSSERYLLALGFKG